MTGVRRANCSCCTPTGVDKCGASQGALSGCTTTTSSCASTYAVSLSLSSFTSKRNCGTESEPDCIDSIIYPALSETITVTQVPTNKCIYTGELDISSGSPTWTSTLCPSDTGSANTYSWEKINVRVENQMTNVLTGAQLQPCTKCGAGVGCAGIAIGIEVVINNDTTGGTFSKLFSVTYFSHCLSGTCSDNLTPCYNYYSTVENFKTEYIECTSANNNFDNECISDGFGFSTDCATNVLGRSQSDWNFGVSIS